MKRYSIQLDGARADCSSFCPQGKAGELHAVITAVIDGSGFKAQLDKLHKASAEFADMYCKDGMYPVLARYFLSDVSNQAETVKATTPFTCPISIIGQPPLDGSKVALWVWLSGEGDNYRHIRTTSLVSDAEDSCRQTEHIFEQLEEQLAENGMTLAGNCVRTWLFVRDVDVNYAGVVRGRRENFLRNGLTEKSHYIASTGIEGRSSCSDNKVRMDAYSIGGLKTGQVKYLYAGDNLNPTYEYGVTFERGASVEYGDRKHVLISGTASIDNRGTIVWKGDVLRQAERIRENIGALLAEAGVGFDDLCHLIVYLRDTADYQVIRSYVDDVFATVPTVITLAPICRPGWLIEMECMATVANDNPSFADL